MKNIFWWALLLGVYFTQAFQLHGVGNEPAMWAILGCAVYHIFCGILSVQYRSLNKRVIELQKECEEALHGLGRLRNHDLRPLRNDRYEHAGTDQGRNSQSRT